MKFLVITNHSYMLWQFRTELLLKLKTFGEVVISMPFLGHEDDFKDLGFRCINTKLDRRGINPFEDLGLYRFYKKLLKSEKPDMVITYSIKPNVYAGFLCRRMKIPYCVNVQGLGTAFQSQPMAFLATQMYKAGIKKSKVVFFENEYNASEFVKRGIVKKEKEVVLNGAGVNLDSYEFKPYPSEDGGVHILYLGRIMKEKGVDETFSAMRIIKEKYKDKVVFDVVGFFEDEYKEIVEKLVDDGVIVFHGFQSNPRPYYAATHGFVSASYHEGMSNVLLEAASTGRALITTDIPGCREAVDEEITGYLCKKMDVETLAECMDKFLSKTYEERKKMGELGRKKMENEFDKNMVVDKTVKMILKD